MARNGHARIMSRHNTSVIVYIILGALVVVLFYFYWSLNTEVKTFRAEKKTLQAELSYNEGEVSKYIQQIKSLTEELQRVTQSKRDVDSEKEKVSAELSETKASLDAANIKTNDCKTGKESLQQQFDTKTDEIDRLTQEAINKQSTIDSCQKEKDERDNKIHSSHQKISSLEEQVKNLQQDKVQLASEVSEQGDQLRIAQNQLRTCLYSQQTSHTDYQQPRNQNTQFSHNAKQWEHQIPDDGRPNIHNKLWSQKKPWIHNNPDSHNNPDPHNNPGINHNLVNNRFDTHNGPQVKQPSTNNEEEGEQPVLGVGADEEKQGKPQNPDLVLGVNHHDNNQNNDQDNENQETDNNKDKQTSKVGGAGGDDGGAGKDYQTDDHQGEPKKEVNPQDEEGGNNDNKEEDNPHQHIDGDKQPIEDSNALHKEDFDHIAKLLGNQKKVDYAKDDENQEHDRLKRQDPFEGAFGEDHRPNGRHNIDDLDLSKFLNKPFDKMPPGFQNDDPNKPGFAHGPFDRRQFPDFQQNPGYGRKPYDNRFRNLPPGFFGDGRSEDEKQLELPMEDHGHQNEKKKPYDRQL